MLRSGTPRTIELAVIALTLGVTVILAAAVPATPLTGDVATSAQNQPEDTGVNATAVDAQLVLTTEADGTEYELLVVGDVEADDEETEGTVACTYDVCHVEGEVDENDAAGYELSGAIVDADADENLLVEVNGTFTADAVEGLGLGGLSPGDGEDDPTDVEDLSVDVPVPSDGSDEPDDDDSVDGDDGDGDDGDNGNGDDSNSDDGNDGDSDVVTDPAEIVELVDIADETLEGVTAEDEHVILENTGDDPVDLSDWTVRDREDGGLVDAGTIERFEFPDDFVLDDGDQVTIWTEEGEDNESDLYWGYERYIWHDDGDTIIVESPDGGERIELEYGDGPGNGDGPIGDPEGIVEMVEVADLTIETEDPEDEHIVLENTGDEPVDLSDWTVRDREDGGLVDAGTIERFEFPDGFVLDDGDQVRIWTGEGEDNGSDLYWGYERHIWHDDGDTIIVESPDGGERIEFAYNGGAPDDDGDDADDGDDGDDNDNGDSDDDTDDENGENGDDGDDGDEDDGEDGDEEDESGDEDGNGDSEDEEDGDDGENGDEDENGDVGDGNDGDEGDENDGDEDEDENEDEDEDEGDDGDDSDGNGDGETDTGDGDDGEDE